MVGLLDKLQSSYFPAFQAMFRDIGEGEDPQVFSYFHTQLSYLVPDYLPL